MSNLQDHSQGPFVPSLPKVGSGCIQIVAHGHWHVTRTYTLIFTSQCLQWQAPLLPHAALDLSYLFLI